MRTVWAFAPYRVTNGKLDGDCYDTAATKVETAAAFHALNVPWLWQPIVPASIGEALAQVEQARRQEPETIVFNFCDGDDVNGYPGLALVRALEAARIPFTGAASRFYELSTSKLASKKALVRARVPTSPWAVLPRRGAVRGVCARLGAPLLVKPAVSAEGWGLTLRSVAASDSELTAARDALLEGEMAEYFRHDTVFAEQFVEGPEYTVFLAGYHERPDEVWTLPPVERAFHPNLPERERIICNDQPGPPYFRDELCPAEMAERVVGLARRAYLAVAGSGYGRVDMRLDRATGELYVLEVNANPGISGEPAVCSVGRMLELAEMSFADLLGAILDQAAAHFARGATRSAARPAASPRVRSLRAAATA